MADALPAKFKAVIYDKPGEISTKVVEVDMPEPAAGDVLIKLTHSGVCHSDYGTMLSAWAHLPPTVAGQIGGHEGVGYVVKLGPGTEHSGVKLGDRVGVKWVSHICGSCLACVSGYDGACFNQKISGALTYPGTFQHYVTSQATYVTPIPDDLPSDAAAPMLCAGITAYSALRKSNTKSGQWVVLLGAGGGLGHLATQIAAGAIGLRVIGIDSGNKREIVMESGAEHFIDFTASKDVAKEVMDLTGGLGAHAVVNLTASNSAYAMSMDMLRFGGTLVCAGIPEGDPLPIASAFPQLLIGKALKIVGVAVGDRKDAIEVLDLAARGVIKTHFRTEKMENLTEVFEQMHKGEVAGRVVLDLQL